MLWNVRTDTIKIVVGKRHSSKTLFFFEKHTGCQRKCQKNGQLGTQHIPNERTKRDQQHQCNGVSLSPLNVNWVFSSVKRCNNLLCNKCNAVSKIADVTIPTKDINTMRSLNICRREIMEHFRTFIVLKVGSFS